MLNSRAIKSFIGYAFALLLVAGLSYLFGAYSFHQGLWPIRYLQAFRQSASPYVPENGAINDKNDRLIAFRGKREIACPKQTDRTMVLLIAGQSNAANSGGQRYAGREHVVNYFAGKCYEAFSPLLGTTGINGESWTLLGNKLVDRQIADQVILVAAAMSGTGIAQWQDGADMNRLLQSVISDATRTYRITHVLWHQGSFDFAIGMTKADYTEKFASLVGSIRKRQVDAPIYVSVDSRCDLTNIPWRPDNPITAAQKALPDSKARIFQGVDTDSLMGALDRLDDCHFAQSGQEKFAEEWARLLAPH